MQMKLHQALQNPIKTEKGTVLLGTTVHSAILRMLLQQSAFGAHVCDSVHLRPLAWGLRNCAHPVLLVPMHWAWYNLPSLGFLKVLHALCRKLPQGV